VLEYESARRPAREEEMKRERRRQRTAERVTNDLFQLVLTVMLLGYSVGAFARVASSAEKRLYPDQTDMHRFLFPLT
jgi:hypothetical protein